MCLTQTMQCNKELNSNIHNSHHKQYEEVHWFDSCHHDRLFYLIPHTEMQYMLYLSNIDEAWSAGIRSENVVIIFQPSWTGIKAWWKLSCWSKGGTWLADTAQKNCKWNDRGFDWNSLKICSQQKLLHELKLVSMPIVFHHLQKRLTKWTSNCNCFHFSIQITSVVIMCLHCKARWQQLDVTSLGNISSNCSDDEF